MTPEAITKARYVSGPRGLELLHEAGIDISKGPYYDGLNDGSIPSIRIGKRFFVRENLVEILGDRTI